MKQQNLILLTVLACVGILGAAPLHAATLTVTSSADNTTVDGQCTLREAILANNAGADSADCVADVTNPWGTADTIAFNIPGAGLHTIQPSVALPANTRTVRIDGYTQPGALMNTLGVSMTYPDAHGLDTQIMIELDGSLIGGGFPVLALNANDSRVAGLSIFNNSFESIQANSSNNLISGNFIGVRADGTTAAGGVYGVVLNASNNTIGNGIYGPNLIAGNGTNVFINNVHGNLVLGNLIGTDRTGTLGLCGGLCDGVSIRGSSGTATSNAVQNNVISGLPGYGIALSGTSNTGISGNAIGISVGGAALGNMGGVRIASSAGGTTVGTWFDNNGIANSTAFDGIMVEGVAPYGDPSGTNIAVTNVFWNNAGLGINLRPIGEAAGTVTANDALDADSGPNGLQNFPVIASAQVNGTGGVDIVFSLNSAANTMYEIRGYANPSCDPSGYGEGRFPASDAGNYPTTDGSGNAGGTLTVPAPLPAGWGVGQFVTLTARNTGTSTSSEFSACVQIAAAPGVPPVMGSVPDQVATVGTPFSLDLSSYVTLTVNPIIAGGYVIASGALPPGLTLNADTGIISGTPTAAGTYNVTVTASDTDGPSNADAIQFVVSAVGNNPPVANNDSYSTPFNTALNVAAAGVLANDSDPDGNAITAVLAAGPSHGMLTLNANGGFTYTPTAGYSGLDSFTYNANDGTVNSASPATVSIAVSAAVVTPPSTPSSPIPNMGSLPGVPGIGVQPTVLALSGGNGPSMTSCLMTTLGQIIGGNPGYQGQNANGGTVIAWNGQLISFYPLDASTGSNLGLGIHFQGANPLIIVTDCGAFTVAPALFNLNEFGVLLNGMGLHAEIDTQGVITVLVGGTYYVARPSYLVTPGSPGTPSLTMGADGLFHFTDSNGNSQVMYPAFLDTAALQNQLSLALGTSFTIIQQDGTALLTFGGQQYILVPDLTLSGIPQAHAMDYWWQDGPNHYSYRITTFPYAETSQGFTVRHGN